MARPKALAPLVLLILIGALTGCSRSGTNATRGKVPIILISIDTLRSDRLPAYGYRNVDTPNLDALRDDSILYRNAYSHCPLTLPSHATILTGLLPAENGIRDNIGFKMRDDVPTIPALLKTAGYATGAAVSAFVMRGESGVGRGFDFFEDEIEANAPNQTLGRIQREGKFTVEHAQKWITAKKAEPFFFLLHLYEPHSPYTPPEPFKSRYSNGYDGEIAHVDEIVGTFLRFLKDEKIYDDAMIILTSDHGEGLGDHGEEEHGIFLYREAIQVPLLVKLPASAHKGSEVTTAVQLIDLFPTILEQAGIPKKPDSAGHGSSLLSFVDKAGPSRAVYSETYYPRFHFGWSDMHSMIDGTNHYIHAPRPELYVLTSDPAEKTNVLSDQRRTYAALRKAIEPLIREAEAPSAIDPEEASKLAALGYLGGTAKVVEGETLADPKDKVETAKLIKEGFRLYLEHDREKALAIFQSLLKDNSRMLDIWDITARTLTDLGRREEAIAAAKRGLQLSPGTTHLAIMIANLSIETGQLEQAEKHAELALKTEPGQAHEALARVWLARNNLDKAEQEANLALAEKRDRAVALLTLGRVQIKRKNYAEALARFDEAERVLGQAKKGGISSLSFYRGDALARLGRDDEAIVAFQKEIRFFPENPQPYQNLILLYVTAGRNEEATRLIFELIERSPTPPSYAAVAETLKVIGDNRGSRYWIRKGLQRFPSDKTLRKMAG